jgi:hypothetical protein
MTGSENEFGAAGESISEVEHVSATTMADLKAIAEPINQNAHRLAKLDQTAYERTAKVDLSEKMDLISGQRPEIASYMSRVRNIFSGGFLALGHDFQEPKEANRYRWSRAMSLSLSSVGLVPKLAWGLPCCQVLGLSLIRSFLKEAAISLWGGIGHPNWPLGVAGHPLIRSFLKEAAISLWGGVGHPNRPLGVAGHLPGPATPFFFLIILFFNKLFYNFKNLFYIYF